MDEEPQSEWERSLCCCVCFDLPGGQVHQCHRGHFVCVSCWDSLAKCPLCTTTLPASNCNRIAQEVISRLPREHCNHCGQQNTTLGHIRECSQRPAPSSPPRPPANLRQPLTPVLEGAIAEQRMSERVPVLERQIRRLRADADAADAVAQASNAIIRERTEERDGYKRDVAVLQQQMVLLESQKVLLQSQKAALEASLKKAGDSLAAEISKVQDQLKKEYGTSQREMLEKFVAMHQKNQLESKKRLAEKQSEIESWVSLLRLTREDYKDELEKLKPQYGSE